MANLWRVLALAWLGGTASPALADDVLGADIPTYEQAEDAVGCGGPQRAAAPLPATPLRPPVGDK